MGMRKLQFLLYFNDFVAALNAYAWWFHGDKICGWFLIENVIVLLTGAWILTSKEK